jgi:hypothetical protein
MQRHSLFPENVSQHDIVQLLTVSLQDLARLVPLLDKPVSQDWLPGAPKLALQEEQRALGRTTSCKSTPSSCLLAASRRFASPKLLAAHLRLSQVTSPI